MEESKEIKQKVKEVLKKEAFNGKSYAQNFCDFYHESFETTIEVLGKDRHIHDGTTFANLIWSYMIHKIKKFAVQDGENVFIKKSKKGRGIQLYLCNELVLRFKKTDKNGTTSNIMTDSVVQFKQQQIEFDAKKLISIDMGYFMNEFKTAIDKIFFICPQDKFSNFWKLEAVELEVKNKTMLFPYQEEEVVEVEQEIVEIASLKQNLKKKDVIRQGNL